MKQATSRALFDFHQTTRRYVTEDKTLLSHCYEKFRYSKVSTLFVLQGRGCRNDVLSFSEICESMPLWDGQKLYKVTTILNIPLWVEFFLHISA
jgi:hypothetical protein